MNTKNRSSQKDSFPTTRNIKTPVPSVAQTAINKEELNAKLYFFGYAMLLNLQTDIPLL